MTWIFVSFMYFIAHRWVKYRFQRFQWNNKTFFQERTRTTYGKYSICLEYKCLKTTFMFDTSFILLNQNDMKHRFIPDEWLYSIFYFIMYLRKRIELMCYIILPYFSEKSNWFQILSQCSIQFINIQFPYLHSYLYKNRKWHKPYISVMHMGKENNLQMSWSYLCSSAQITLWLIF